MRRLLAELPNLRRSIALAAVATGALAAGHALTCQTRQAQVAGNRVTPIHVKFRPGVHAGVWGHNTKVRPLFTQHLHRQVAAYDDPRDRWVRIEVPQRDAARWLDSLSKDPNIEQAFVPPTVTLPTPDTADIVDESIGVIAENALDDSCPIHTPSFESHQGYLGPAPYGIDAPAAWRRGILGQGVWFADIEGGWNTKHEDLPGDRISHAGGEYINDPSWRAHGTAVLGEVVGRDNGKGVVGIAPETERVFTSSIGNSTVAEAIDNAAEALRPGDVLLIELQGGGPRGRYLPVEFWDDNFDAIQAATQRGVIVIEAAGNGAENLDHKSYGGKLSRGKRDSGAIMIGAGGPNRPGFHDRTRLDFSNFGTRVDVQGWGRMVATLDYGDLQKCSDMVDRHYTGLFSGTSSASPIVAGAAVLLQSYAKQKGRILSPVEVRKILTETGSPQTGNTKEQIGPRPDLARALPALQ